MRHGHTFIIFQMSIQLFQHCYLQGHFFFHPRIWGVTFLDKISICSWSYFWIWHSVHIYPAYSGTLIIDCHVFHLPPALPSETLSLASALCHSHGRLAWESYNHCFLVFGFWLNVPMGALRQEIGEKWARSLFSWLLPAGSPWLTCVPGQNVTRHLKLAILHNPLF